MRASSACLDVACPAPLARAAVKTRLVAARHRAAASTGPGFEKQAAGRSRYRRFRGRWRTVAAAASPLILASEMIPSVGGRLTRATGPRLVDARSAIPSIEKPNYTEFKRTELLLHVLHFFCCFCFDLVISDTYRQY